MALSVRAHGDNRSSDIAEQFCLENELAFLVLLRSLVRLVVFPAHRLFALLAGDVPYDMAASRHVTIVWLAHVDVDDAVEQVGLAMLSAEVLATEQSARVGQLAGALDVSRAMGVDMKKDGRRARHVPG